MTHRHILHHILHHILRHQFLPFQYLPFQYLQSHQFLPFQYLRLQFGLQKSPFVERTGAGFAWLLCPRMHPPTHGGCAVGYTRIGRTPRELAVRGSCDPTQTSPAVGFWSGS